MYLPFLTEKEEYKLVEEWTSFTHIKLNTEVIISGYCGDCLFSYQRGIFREDPKLGPIFDMPQDNCYSTLKKGQAFAVNVYDM